MNKGLIGVDTVQTLVRAVLKVGGGVFVGKGLAEESAVEAITAGAVALVGIIWGIYHRNKGREIRLTELPLLCLLGLALGVAGCASANTVAFRTEKLATDAAYAGLISWKAYYAAALTNTSPERLGALNERNEQVYAASRQFAATVAIADGIRESCVTNAAGSNRTALQLTLRVATDQSSNLVWLVRSYMK